MRYQAAPLPDAGDPLGGIAAGGKRARSRRYSPLATKKKGRLPEEPPCIVPSGEAGRCETYFLAGAVAFAASARIESAALFRLSDALPTAAEAALLVRSLA